MESKETNSQPKEQFRVVINREANEVLENFVAILNEGATTSKISRSDVANYLFSRLERFLKESEIGEIREICFDAKKALEGLLKGGEELPEHLREVLLKHCGIKPTTKEKRGKKLSTPKIVENVS